MERHRETLFYSFLKWSSVIWGGNVPPKSHRLANKTSIQSVGQETPEAIKAIAVALAGLLDLEGKILLLQTPYTLDMVLGASSLRVSFPIFGRCYASCLGKKSH